MLQIVLNLNTYLNYPVVIIMFLWKEHEKHFREKYEPNLIKKGYDGKVAKVK